MIVTKPNERFYLNPWGYNACRIMSTLAEIVISHGGNVKSTIPCKVSDRHKYDVLEDLNEKADSLEEMLQDTDFQEYLGKVDKEKSEQIFKHFKSSLEKTRMEIRKCEDEINYDKPITVSHTTYVTFELDGVYYYYQVDNNPFFEFHYVKTPITEKGYSKDACMMEDDKKWLYDCYFKSDCPSEMIVDASIAIFEMLVKAENSPIHRDSRRTRVRNTYNNGYHYETIYAKERFARIDF